MILLRSPDAAFFPEHWDFPGGKLEPAEDPKKGIEREVSEETKLRIDAREVLGTYDMDLEKDGQSIPHRFAVYSAEVLEGEVKMSHEHTDFRWATKEEILELKIEPYMRLFFEETP
ncbi:NUDIX domain-containing protein [Candidatus Woesearchaeota archaeon]|nr:NUDIX domain-containing protein [Candidatus Woesearchaeota archaeon]